MASPSEARQHPQMPSHCDKDLKGANEIISSAFYSSVTTTKLDEMAPCSSHLRPILLPSTPTLSFKRIWDPEDPQASGVSNCRLLPSGWFPRGRFSFPQGGVTISSIFMLQRHPLWTRSNVSPPLPGALFKGAAAPLTRSINVNSARKAKAKGGGHWLIVHQAQTRPTPTSTLGGQVTPIKC